MTQTFQMSTRQRRFNAVLVTLLRRGLPIGPFYLLTVQGRKTGEPRHLPVTPIIHHDQWWLVSPYGEVNWVRNVRAAGEVLLTRGRHRRTFFVRELTTGESAPILKEYVTRFAIVRPYFDATPEAPLEAFQAESAYHPVFQLIAGHSVPDSDPVLPER
ncbi:MAG: nitroreductase family deazaflavin-dependent oxidoreductase [Ktedonobacterales bacterium]